MHIENITCYFEVILADIYSFILIKSMTEFKKENMHLLVCKGKNIFYAVIQINVSSRDYSQSTNISNDYHSNLFLITCHPIYLLLDQLICCCRNNTQPFVTYLFHYHHNFNEQSRMRNIHCLYIRQQNGKNDLIYGTVINKQNTNC